MATITNEALANSISSTTTLTLTATAAVGTLLLLGVAADNAGTAGAASLSASVTDSAGNSWINQSLTNQTAGVVADGTTLGIWSCIVTSALVAGTVTVNFSPATAAKAAVMRKVTPAAGEMVSIVAVGAGASGSGSSWAAPTVSVTAGDTIVGFVAVESRGAASDVDTTNGSWSTIYTTVGDTTFSTSSQTVATQSKTVNATGNQTYDPGGSVRDFAANYLILRSISPTLNAAGTSAMTVEAGYAATAEMAASGAAAMAPVATAIGFARLTAAGAASVTFAATREFFATMRAAGKGRARFIAVKRRPPPGRLSARLLFRFDWADSQVTRLWLGSGPYVDADGALWRGAALVDGDQLADIQQAVNGNASALNVALSGVSPETAGVIWTYVQDGNLIGSTMQILVQPCNDRHRPVGATRVVFGGNVDNAVFEDVTQGDEVLSTVTAAVTNKFMVRNLVNGAVLSDADQRARSALLNPGAPPDRFAERAVLMQSVTLTWPRNSG